MGASSESKKRESAQTKVPPSPAFYSHVETCQQETFSQVNTGFLEDLALMILMKGVGVVVIVLCSLRGPTGFNVWLFFMVFEAGPCLN